MRREQRLVFGEVAEQYDRHRPGYPDALIDDLVALAGLERGSLVLEIGAGTGKATAMFAARGIHVLGIEPSAEMAGVARRVCATGAEAGGGAGGWAGGEAAEVRIEEADFEAWEPAGRTFPLVFAGQAWHWVEPGVGFAKAASVLVPGGVMAAFWNWAVWAQVDSPLREAALDAYRHEAPEILAETDPIHPGGSSLPTDEEDWRRGIAAAVGLGAVEVRGYEWSLTYSAGDYARLLETHSTVRALHSDRRSALVGAVARAIEEHGGVLTLPILTRLCLARRDAA